MRKELQDFLDRSTPEQLRAELDKRKSLQTVEMDGKFVVLSDVPWWRKDKYGWPIETFKGKRLKSFTRIFLQNLRKFLP